MVRFFFFCLAQGEVYSVTRADVQIHVRKCKHSFTEKTSQPHQWVGGRDEKFTNLEQTTVI